MPRSGFYMDANREWKKVTRETQKRGRAEVGLHMRAALTTATESERGALLDGLRGQASPFLRPTITSSQIPRVRVTVFSKTIRLAVSTVGHDWRAWNGGSVRHPLFGNTDHWYNTPAPSMRRMWTRSVRPVRDAIRLKAAAALEVFFKTGR